MHVNLLDILCMDVTCVVCLSVCVGRWVTTGCHRCWMSHRHCWLVWRHCHSSASRPITSSRYQDTRLTDSTHYVISTWLRMKSAAYRTIRLLSSTTYTPCQSLRLSVCLSVSVVYFILYFAHFVAYSALKATQKQHTCKEYYRQLKGGVLPPLT